MFQTTFSESWHKAQVTLVTNICPITPLFLNKRGSDSRLQTLALMSTAGRDKVINDNH